MGLQEFFVRRRCDKDDCGQRLKLADGQEKAVGDRQKLVCPGCGKVYSFLSDSGPAVVTVLHPVGAY